MLTAKITQVSLANPSKHGGAFYYVYLKGGDRSYRMCLYRDMRNFKRWQVVLDAFESGKEVVLSNLSLKTPDVVDADSLFKIAGEAEPVPAATTTAVQEPLFSVDQARVDIKAMKEKLEKQTKGGGRR